MPSVLPDGEAVPATGPLTEAARAGVGDRKLSFYLHVPYCTTRCGYCDFNTYTAAELGSAPGTARESYLRAARAEIAAAADQLGPAAPKVSTVFVGGGTPTLLTTDELGSLVGEVRERFGLLDGAEVTTEANPETISPEYLDGLLEAGFTRISLGMQSVRQHVLTVLDRTHTPGQAQLAARQAKEAGFEHVSLDLIYGTPSESLDDWRASLEAVVEARPDHVSAYALIVEQGTRLAAQIKRGRVPMTDDDDLADKYLLAADLLSQAGFGWYEVSNWARGSEAQCRHNLAYWRGDDWWGIGPGAHSHVGGVRWWNAKHPARYTAALAEGRLPAVGREVLGDSERRVERVLLELRLSDGLPLEVLTDSERARVSDIVADGHAVLVEGANLGERIGPRMTLTLSGRLLADGVVRRLLD